VIYFHCGHGQDRTGELAAAYLLQYTAASFQEVWRFNRNLGMDVPANINAMQWLCEWVRVTARPTLNCALS
jgi:protein tyrosine/serine phosphatase